MRTIHANTPLRFVPVPVGVQSVDSSEVQASISVDGLTFTDYGDAFTGSKVFDSLPVGMFIRFDHDIYLADSL